MKGLENIFLLKGLEQNEKQEIIKSFKDPVSYKKGDVIYSAVRFPNAVGYVVKGETAAVTNNGNKKL